MSSIPISQGYISKLSESTKKRLKLRPARQKGGDDNSELGGQLPATKRTAHGCYWNKIYIECNVESVRIHVRWKKWRGKFGDEKKKKVSHNQVCVRSSFVQNLYCIVRFEPKHEAVYDNLVRFSKTCVFPCCPVEISGDFTKMRDGI